ncbi:MAG: hypothetical protein ACYTGG_09985 [Planctomycetota bacterium]
MMTFRPDAAPDRSDSRLAARGAAALPGESSRRSALRERLEQCMLSAATSRIRLRGFDPMLTEPAAAPRGLEPEAGDSVGVRRSRAA